MDDTIYRQAAIDEIEYELEMINSALDSITLDFNARERLRQRRGEAREILNSIQQLPSAQPERCSDCIANGGDWECDHIHCHKGQLPSAQPEILACGEGELNIPDTNVVERKTGKWIKLYDDTFHCQLCGHTFMVIQGEDSMNYCPNCGAKME